MIGRASANSDLGWKERIVEFLLERLRTYKLGFYSIAILVISIFLIVISFAFEKNSIWQPVVISLGSAGLGTALVTIGFTMLVAWETEKLTTGRLENLLETFKTGLLNELPKVILLSEENMSRILSGEVPDELLRTIGSALSGHDPEGAAFVASLVRTWTQTKEFWRNYRFEATLFPTDSLTHNNVDLSEVLFDVVAELRYEALLHQSQFSFACVKDIGRFESALKHREFDSIYYLSSWNMFPSIDHTVFDVQFIEINNLELQIEPIDHKDDSVAIVQTRAPDHLRGNLGKLVGKRVNIRYRVKTKVRKHGHFYAMLTQFPAINVSMTFDYSRVPIAITRPIVLFASASIPKIDEQVPKKIQVDVSGWSAPISGVVFVWTLDDEASIESRGLSMKTVMHSNSG